MLINAKKAFIILLPIIIIITLLKSFSNKILQKPALKIESGKNMTFFIATDIHYLAKELTDGNKAFKDFIESGDGKELTYIEEITDAFIYDIKRKKPDVLLLAGDLTNNGEKESHIKLTKKLKEIEKSGTSVYVVPGNHDISNPWAREFKGHKQHKVPTISDKDFKKLYSDFGYKKAISKDENSLSYLAAPSKDIWLLMLDTNKYKYNLKLGWPEAGGRIKDETYKWIKECGELAKKNNAEIIAVMHHSLIDHSPLIKDNFTIKDNEKLINIFKEYNIKLTFSGHIHIQDIKSFTDGDYTVYDIATSALSVYPHQYGVLKYSPNKGYHYTTSKIDVENWAKENNIPDRNMIDFNRYSKLSFSNHSYRRFYDRLLQLGKFSDSEKRIVSTTTAEINLKYFEGFRNELLSDFKNKEGILLLEESSKNFLKSYVLNMFDDEYTDNTKLRIPIN